MPIDVDLSNQHAFLSAFLISVSQVRILNVPCDKFEDIYTLMLELLSSILFNYGSVK